MLRDLRYSAPQGFVAEPLCIKFKGTEDLEEYLDAAKAARPLLIKRPEDILLSLDGLVQQRYQLTPWGLWSLCRRLSPNLGSVISDLTYLDSKRRGRKKFEPDIRSAVMILNTMIRSRFFQTLEGARLIVDPVRKTIDGVVGSRYSYLSNALLYESSSDFVKSMGGGIISAVILGRRIFLRYVNPDLFMEANGMDYALGWGFSNSETGQSSVRGGLLLVDKYRCSSMKAVFRKTHTSDLEDGFRGWLKNKMRKSTEVFDAENIKRCFNRLSAAIVPCDLGCAKEAGMSLFARLQKFIPKPIARGVAQEFFNPSDVYSDSALWRPPTSPIPVVDKRSRYFLYESLTRAAMGCPPEDQEAVECLAYKFLRGEFDPF